MVDWTDPCAKAIALREAYYRLIAGDQEAEIENRSGEGQQRVKFHRVDIETLKSEMIAAEEACQRANGITPAPRRSAIRAGGVRRNGWGC